MTESIDDKVGELLCRYLDGEVSRRQRRDIERRLETDEALREQLRQYAALDGHLAALAGGEVEGVDYGLQRATIVAAVERKALLAPPRRRPVLLRRPVWALAAAASVLLLVSAAWFLHEPPPRTGGDVVVVEIPPLSRYSHGAGQVSVSLSPAGSQEPPLAERHARGDATPPGTIVVSVAPEAPRRRGAEDTMVIY